MNQTIELIASGYEWICPVCENFQKEIETSCKVTCKKCNRTFEVSNIHHATG